ncbi:hypothetical protein AB4Y45_32335 [Paraburkholderia sp. EG287A]|uniref:hypothetical protein n=1 Tax=Paraburkholderia sp. EG287A TaxID=3237012 RepID=UPI0034D2BE75
MNEVLPVLTLVASSWVVLGYTNCKEGAVKLVTERVAAATGGAVRAWRRTLMQIETQGGPDGYCFKIDGDDEQAIEG